MDIPRLFGACAATAFLAWGSIAWAGEELEPVVPKYASALIAQVSAPGSPPKGADSAKTEEDC